MLTADVNPHRRDAGVYRRRLAQRRQADRGIHRPPFGEGARHLARVMDTLPKTVETFRARADAGFSCWEAVKAYTNLRCEFVIAARKTDRLLEFIGRVCWASLLGELQAADWWPSPDTDADFACQFRYQPEGWERECRFVGLRHDQPEPDADHPDQIGLFDGLAFRYPAFVTNISGEKGSSAAVENLIKASNHDIGLTAHPSGQWTRSANPFQLSMIAYNLNCWLELFEREESVTVPELRHRTVATTRLRLLYSAARITRHGGQTEIHFGSQYQERDRLDRLIRPVDGAAADD
jgi:hypothetical protein